MQQDTNEKCIGHGQEKVVPQMRLYVTHSRFPLACYLPSDDCLYLDPGRSRKTLYTGVGRAGPRIKLSLPSFSGRTAESPNMLQYACHLATNVRLVQPLAISFDRSHETNSEARNGSLEELRGVMGGRPVLALAFDKMEMIVHQPLPVPEKLPSVMWQVQETDPCPQLVGSR